MDPVAVRVTWCHKIWQAICCRSHQPTPAAEQNGVQPPANPATTPSPEMTASPEPEVEVVLQQPTASAAPTTSAHSLPIKNFEVTVHGPYRKEDMGILTPRQPSTSTPNPATTNNQS
ncbi:hypothetical protein QR680_000552 [Steinernema hermaphroditum]|uniref:Uncharacterized protein n=1 Tax=Steinernema hermaphroditum TaxID=289476 RepID=A0AA39GXS3_9BILA|nr:hypothetical protein QR680_000552 [Steinernema hermaphroditum]